MIYLQVIVFSIIQLGFCLNLPDNLISHLDTESPYYTTRLNPWNFTYGSSSANQTTLKLVIGVGRHGNRPPSETYDNDKYPINNPKFWPDGPKQLTAFGKNQLFKIGQRLRTRYEGFLSPYYKPNEFQIASNNVDRVKMSAAVLLAGLYPPAGFQVWNKGINWQPIPISELPYDMSAASTDSSICPAFYAKLLESVDAVNKYNKNHEKMFKYLNNRTGKNITILSDIYIYWEIFRLVDERGYTLPDWAWRYYPHEIANLQATVMGALCAATPDMITLLAGPQVKKYAQLLKEVSNGQSSLKIYLELVHETSINGILPVFGFNEPFYVDTGAFFVIELHQLNDLFYVEMLYYKNEKQQLPQVLEIKNCGSPCPLEIVLQMIDNHTPNNWEQECRLG